LTVNVVAVVVAFVGACAIQDTPIKVTKNNLNKYSISFLGSSNALGQFDYGHFGIVGIGH
jgi:hypothetical protein